jgi:hypothetical protein
MISNNYVMLGETSQNPRKKPTQANRKGSNDTGQTCTSRACTIARLASSVAAFNQVAYGRSNFFWTQSWRIASRLATYSFSPSVCVCVPDSPKQPDAIVPELVSVDPEADEDDPMLQHGELLFCNRAPGEEYTPSDDDSSEEEDPLGLQQQVSESSRVGRGRLSAAEVTLFLLDWMCSHKQTDKAARDIWSLCQLLLPGQVDIPTFTQVKKLLVVPHTPLS